MVPARTTLMLAAGAVTFDGAPEWRKTFPDSEQTMALHRWMWLLTAPRTRDEGLALMRSWLAAMGPIPEGIGGTPYTTSERIVNGMLFLRAHGTDVPDDLHAAFLAMAEDIARRFEYHGPRATGNHVVNNARALAIVGYVLGIPPYADLARAVLADALPWLITSDGFLREESSHYHLLVTRWLLDIGDAAAAAGDDEMRALLTPWVPQMVARCWFFLVPDARGGWQIPLVGDVSPDCTPQWLLAHLVPRIARWQPEACDGVQAFPQSGWFRLDRGATTFFVHVPQEAMVHQATHGHADLGSFVLFADGVPIIVDPGRPTYDAGDPRYGESGSAAAHSTLVIDGFGPMPYDRERHIPPWYQHWSPRVTWEERGDACVLTIAHAGFRRIAGDRVDHIRRFIVRDRVAVIEDHLKGLRRHDLGASFPLAPGAACTVACADPDATIDTEEYAMSSAYGVLVPARAVVVRQTVTLPHTMTLTLRW